MRCMLHALQHTVRQHLSFRVRMALICDLNSCWARRFLEACASSLRCMQGRVRLCLVFHSSASPSKRTACSMRLSAAGTCSCILLRGQSQGSLAVLRGPITPQLRPQLTLSPETHSVSWRWGCQKTSAERQEVAV